jgi:hypothetical protein
MQTSTLEPDRYPGLKKWVISRLSGHKEPNDIVFGLCNRTGWDWKQAQQFVQQVVEENQKEIHQRRLPLLFGIGLLMVVGGAVSSISAFIDLSAILKEFQQPFEFSRLLEFILQARGGYLMLIKLAIGMAMVIGGCIGTGQALTAAMTGSGEILLREPPGKI